jgi:cephalosporin hydroxylase
MSENQIWDAYHQWYYDSEVWEGVVYLGVPCNKSVSDMWNYQEILFDLTPSLIVEFGTRFGGSALFFSVTGRAINPSLKILTVDVRHDEVFPQVITDSTITMQTSSSLDPAVYSRIRRMREVHPGPVFFILDSDHRKDHVLAELHALRSVVESGDYVVVEDGNINGNPVLPAWGEGPYEAIAEYLKEFPKDYTADSTREKKFGFTFAPSGFLIKN